MCVMSYNWRRLGNAYRDARNALNLSRPALAEMAGVSVGALKSLEKGDGYKTWPPTAEPVAKALGWPEGRAREIAEGTFGESEDPRARLQEFPAADGTHFFAALIKDLADMGPDELAEVTAYVEYVKARIANRK